MVEAAREQGYQYIAVTDHSKSLKLTNSLSEARFRAQFRTIDKLSTRLNDFVVLKSAEVDMLEHGKLEYSQAMLRQLNLMICSLHSRFGLTGRGGFSSQTDDYVLLKHDLPSGARNCGSDLRAVTPREMLVLFVGARVRHFEKRERDASVLEAPGIRRLHYRAVTCSRGMTSRRNSKARFNYRACRHASQFSLYGRRA